MTSKTFKSVTDNESELDVRANDCGVFIAFSRAGKIRQASTFAPSDAPALALAILEAAGVRAKWHNGFALGTQQSLESATEILRECVASEAKRTAEAEAQAELEAEALELLNASNEAIGISPHSSTDFIGEIVMRRWLAVARKAREMRAEK